MSTPLVSVVIPVYNGRAFLRRAVESALGQTYAPLEVIAVDDGSKDDSAQALASFGPRVTVLRQPNRGVSHARNAGIQAARGDLVAFLDQDDWWLPEKVARQVAVLRASPEVGLVHTDVAYYEECLGSFVPGLDRTHSPRLVGRCYDSLVVENGVCSASVVVRAAVLREVGGFDTEHVRGNTVQDYDLWLRVARRAAFAYVPEALTVYRLHPAQGMLKKREFYAEYLRLLERVVGDPYRTGPPRLRRRVAAALQILGVSHLDAGERRPARRYFARALRAHYSARAALLYGASLLPAAPLAWLRRARSALRGFLVRPPAAAWVE